MSSKATAGPRKRTGPNTFTSSEDTALNMIAKEAEARLAAKRAARAEARSIRMKELERLQKEADEKMDKEFKRTMITEDTIKKKVHTRIASVPHETDVVDSGISSEVQVKNLQDKLRDLEEKYKKVMVSIAQLDNEKQALTYEVHCLKDRLEDEEEESLNLKDELAAKSREYNLLHRENENNAKEAEKLRQMVLERDRVLEENGIDLDDFEQQDVIVNDISMNRLNGGLTYDSSIEIEQSGSIRSRGSSRRSSSAPEDRESLLDQIKSLKEEVSDLRRENDIDYSMQIKNVAAEDMRRDLQKQLAELKLKSQKMEQENARLEGNLLRLETQVKRYKSQAEQAEAVEDKLLGDKRRIARELRQTQEQIMELETEKEHLQKRLEKLKQRRKEEL